VKRTISEDAAVAAGAGEAAGGAGVMPAAARWPLRELMDDRLLDALPELRRRGFGLIAVSPQKPDESLTLQEKKELTFTVLSDPGNVLAARFGIVTTPSPDVIEAQLKLGLDLTQGNADGTTAIPMPTTVVIDADRIVRWIDVHPDYGARSEVSDILAAINAIGSGSAR
jgi:peroxiredoxin